jgi:hypothetical protein
LGETTKVGISASKVVALIGALIAIREAITYFFRAPSDALFILWGIIALVIAIFIFISLDIIDFKKFHLPFIWWILLIFGVALLLLAFFYTGQYIACTLILIAFLLEFLSEKKTFIASKIVVLIGSCITIYESIMIFIGGASLLWVNAIFAIIFALILILSLWDKVDIKIPFAWWVVLIAGFVIFTWLSIFSGTIIMVGFLLMLMAY